MTATIAEELLQILADPETHEPLTLATAAQLEAIRAAIGRGLKTHAGGDPPAELDGALLSQGGRVAYLIHDGVPNLLIDDRLDLPSS